MITRPTFWTAWRVKRALKEMLEQLEREEDLPIAQQTVQVGKLFTQRKFDPTYLTEWDHKYSGDHSEIKQSIATIRKTMEVRLNEGGLRNKLNPFQVAFNLKNNYGWREEQFIHDDKAEAIAGELETIRMGLAAARAVHVPHQVIRNHQGEQLPPAPHE